VSKSEELEPRCWWVCPMSSGGGLLTRVTVRLWQLCNWHTLDCHLFFFCLDPMTLLDGHELPSKDTTNSSESVYKLISFLFTYCPIQSPKSKEDIANYLVIPGSDVFLCVCSSVKCRSSYVQKRLINIVIFRCFIDPNLFKRHWVLKYVHIR
jgi:hypothetical protein